MSQTIALRVTPDSVAATIALRATPGRRLVLEEGGMTLDGLGIAPRADLPAEGAVVPYGPWARKRLDEGDAEPVPADVLADAQKRQAEREAPAEATAAAPAAARNPKPAPTGPASTGPAPTGPATNDGAAA